MHPFCLLLKSQYMEILTSDRTIISGKFSTEDRHWIYKTGISHRKSPPLQHSLPKLKLFTRRFIHCFPMCEITLQIKQWPYSSPGFWEPPNRTSNESWSGAVDDIRCHLVAIITYYNMIDDCESSHHSGSRNCNITTTNLIQSNALIFRSQCFELARLNSNCVPQCFALCAHQTFQVFMN